MFKWKGFRSSTRTVDQKVEAEPPSAQAQGVAPASSPLKSGKALFDGGRAAFHTAGDPDRALPLLRAALVRFDSAAERNEQLAAVSCNDIGLILKSRGELAEAESMFRRASEFFERVHGPGHHDTATTMHNVGATLLQRGNVEQGGLFLTRSFELIRQFHANDKMDLMHAYQHQGMLHRARGDRGKVVSSYRAGVEIARSFLPMEHAEMRTLVRDLAVALGEVGETREALDGWKALVSSAPEGSSNAADALLEVAHAERKLANAAAALDAYRRAGAIHAHCAGPLSEGHVRASLGEALALVALRKDAESEDVLERLAEGLRQGGPARRRLFGEVMSELGEFYSVRAQYAQAREALDCARTALEAELGADHHRTCEAVARLASVLERTGDRAGAESLYRSVVRAVESWQRFKEAWIATYGDRVARLCQQRNAHAEAEVWLRRAIRNAEIAWGSQASVFAGMQYRLGAILQEQDARGAAWTTLLQALGAFQRNDALEDKAVADILKRLVRMISADAEPRDVQAFLRDLIARLEGAYPENHLNVAFLYRAMGESLAAQGDPRAALPWLERAVAMTLHHYGSDTDEMATRCMFLEDTRIAAAGGRLRPWVAGLPPAGEGMTWQLRLSYGTDDWEGVANLARRYLEDTCATWLADLDQFDDWIDVTGTVATFDATCGAHEHLIVVSTEGLVLSVMGQGPAASDSRLAELETRLLLALARNPEIVIVGWTLSVGRAGAQVQIAAGDAAALAARLAPGDGSVFS